MKITKQKFLLLTVVVSVVTILVIVVAMKAIRFSGADPQRVENTSADTGTLSPSERARRVTIMQDALAVGTAEFETDDLHADAQISPEVMSSGALAEVYLNRSASKAQEAINYLLADQNMTKPADPLACNATYGDIPFTLNNPNSVGKNNNSNSFVAIGVILNGYKDRLGASFADSKKANFEAMMYSIKRYNKCLWPLKDQDLVNFVLMGQYLNQPDTVQMGSDKLTELINQIKSRGISEYDSPGYYATTLVSHTMGYIFAKDPAIKAKFKTIIEYYWEDIMANYWKGNKSFTGPNSRSYAWDYNVTGMDYYLFGENLGRLDSSSNLGKIHPFIGAYQTINTEERGYHPNGQIVNLGSIATRVVKSKWDTLPGGDRYNFITPDFTLGASSHDYSDKKQDRSFSAELANVNLLRMSTVTDGKNRGYGKINHSSAIGQSGTRDFYLDHPVGVQEQGNLLYLTNVQPKSRTGVNSLYTNWYLPSGANSIYVNGQKVSITNGTSVNVGINGTVGVRYGNGAIVFRTAYAEACEGRSATVTYKAETEGLNIGAVRFIVDHKCANDTEAANNANIKSAMIIKGATVTSDAEYTALENAVRNASVQTSTSGNFYVKTTVSGVTLEANQNLTTGDMISRKVNGKELSFKVFELNGTEIVIGQPLPPIFPGPTPPPIGVTPTPMVSATPTPSPIPFQHCLPLGDMSDYPNCKGSVNSLDLSYMLSKLGSTDQKANLDDQGLVTSIDLSTLLSNLGK
jgi:hypothetical protein